MQNLSPLLTVLMPVFNAEHFLCQAIESILNQTYSDFEFLIINDKSTDSSVDIIESYNDSRIWLVHNETNLGVTKTLNKGIKLAHGKYIARIDADDVSMPHRFETQLKYFDSDPTLTLCSSSFKVIDANGNVIRDNQPPSTSGDLMEWHLLAWHLLFMNHIAHSSVMAKKEVLLESGGYPDWAVVSADYGLWSSISMRYKMILVPDTLVCWRNHDNGLTRRCSEKQNQISFCISHRAHQELIDSSINKEYSIELRKLIYRACYAQDKSLFISSKTVNALKLLNNLRRAFVNRYQPDSATQEAITNMIRQVNSDLVQTAVHRVHVLLNTIKHVLFTFPGCVIYGLLRSLARVIRRVLSPVNRS